MDDGVNLIVQDSVILKNTLCALSRLCVEKKRRPGGHFRSPIVVHAFEKVVPLV